MPIFSLLLIFISSVVFAQVKVRYLNERFMWIEVPSKYVKARLNHPRAGLTLCWVEVKTPKEEFDFITRRAVSYDECLSIVLESRKLIKKNDFVEIIGSGSSKEKKGDYFSMFELIRGKTGCQGYFGDCENFEKNNDEWEDWKSRPIDPKLYP